MLTHQSLISKMKTQNCNEVVVVMVPFPAQGHLNQLLHLSHLISSYGLPVHYTGSSIHNHQVKIRLAGRGSETHNNIHFHDFPLPHLNTLPTSSQYVNNVDQKIESDQCGKHTGKEGVLPPEPENSTHFPTHLEPLFDIPTQIREPVSQLIQELSTNFRRVIVIFDSLMTSVVQQVTSIPNVESYLFFPVSAFTIFTNIWEIIPEKPFKLDSDFPTCIPSNEGCLTPKVSEFIFNQQKLLGFESGVLCNTSRVVEGKFMEYLEKLSINPDAKFFAVGPLNPVKMESKVRTGRHKCLEWLDKQEQGTVIYICFGSTTSMTDDQIRELGVGLERSEQKFIWVLRKADRIDITNGGLEGEFCLPEGFEKRVKNRGMVVREWVPQVEILGHSSVGGFMSHCGWNSCMESISMGVPIAAWPMHSDQPRNGVLVTEVLKVGLLVRDWMQRGSLVMATTIENVVKRLMVSEEGMEMRKRATELGNAVRASVGSHMEMDSFVSHITR